jgi:hypothetical protein
MSYGFSHFENGVICQGTLPALLDTADVTLPSKDARPEGISLSPSIAFGSGTCVDSFISFLILACLVWTVEHVSATHGSRVWPHHSYAIHAHEHEPCTRYDDECGRSSSCLCPRNIRFVRSICGNDTVMPHLW